MIQTIDPVEPHVRIAKLMVEIAAMCKHAKKGKAAMVNATKHTPGLRICIFRARVPKQCLGRSKVFLQ